MAVSITQLVEEFQESLEMIKLPSQTDKCWVFFIGGPSSGQSVYIDRMLCKTGCYSRHMPQPIEYAPGRFLQNAVLHVEEYSLLEIPFSRVSHLSEGPVYIGIYQ